MDTSAGPDFNRVVQHTHRAPRAAAHATRSPPERQPSATRALPTQHDNSRNNLRPTHTLLNRKLRFALLPISSEEYYF